MGTQSYSRLQWALIVALLCLSSAIAGQQQHEVRKRDFKDPTTTPGKPVVLIFVRTDCPISNRYAPTIQSLAAKYAGRVGFWLVYPSKSDTDQIIAAKLLEFGYKLPWMHDTDLKLVAKAKATITPEAGLFDASGQLRYHGRIDDLYVSLGRTRRSPTKNDLDDAVAAVLAGTSVKNDSAPAVGCYISDLK